MKTLCIAMAIGAGALLAGSAANAADNTVKAKPTTEIGQSPTDFSSRRRYYRHYGFRHYRHYGYRRYRPYYRSYGYAPRPYYGYGGGYGGPYYGGGYGYGGPSVSFSFGGGGYRGW